MGQLNWIISYPGSGSTWMRFLLTSYLTNTAVMSADDIRTHAPDIRMVTGSGEMLDTGPGGPRVAKSNLLPATGIMQLYKPSTSRVVYLVRNPRDLVVHLVRHMGISYDDQEGVHRFAEEFIHNHGTPFFRMSGSGSWPENVENWTNPERFREQFPGVELLVVRYEDLKADPIGRFHDVVEFLDIDGPVRSSDVEKAVESSTLERMREVERTSPTAMPGVSPFGAPGQVIGQGRSGQSLAFIGEDIEDAYQRLLGEGSEFSRTARRFGYGDDVRKEAGDGR